MIKLRMRRARICRCFFREIIPDSMDFFKRVQRLLGGVCLVGGAMRVLCLLLLNRAVPRGGRGQEGEKGRMTALERGRRMGSKMWEGVTWIWMGRMRLLELSSMD